MHKNSFVGNFALFGCPKGGAQSRRREVATLSLPHVVVVKVFLLRSGWVWGAGAATKNYAYAQLNPQQIPFLFVGICCCLFMCVHVCVWPQNMNATRAALKCCILFSAHEYAATTAAAMRTKPAASAFAVYLFIPVFIYLFIYSFVVLVYSRALRILCNVASSIVHGMPTLTSDL